jgi:hypothetical protein
MADCKLNEADVLTATITLTLSGAWMANVEIDASDPAAIVNTSPRGAVITYGGQRFIGTVRRQGVFAARRQVEIVGGAGGLATPMPSQAYQGVPLSVPLSDLIRASGETLSGAVNPSVQFCLLRRWMRSSGTVGAALDALASSSSYGWRVLADGSVWIGNETWSDVTIDHDLIESDSSKDQIVIASEALSILPGTTFRGRRVSSVQHSVDDEKVRTIVTFATSGLDRLRGAVEAVVLGLVARFDYHGAYRCEVLAQNTDGTLELKPTGKRMGPISRVQIRSGIPGVSVKVKKGGWVLLEFEDGDPRSPIATLWDSASLDEIKITADTKVTVIAPRVLLADDSGDEKPIARLGDMVEIVLPPSMPVSGTVSGAPFAGLLTITDSGLGVITSGSDKVSSG